MTGYVSCLINGNYLLVLELILINSAINNEDNVITNMILRNKGCFPDAYCKQIRVEELKTLFTGFQFFKSRLA